MHSFTFTSVHKSGKKIQGVIKARDKIDAIRRLERAGCIPLTIKKQTNATCGNIESSDSLLVSRQKSKGTIFALSLVLFGLLGWLTVSRFSPKANPVPIPPLKSTIAVHKRNNVKPLVYPDVPAVPEDIAATDPTPTQEFTTASVAVTNTEPVLNPPVEVDNRKFVRWSLGVVDPNFGITAEQFRKAIKAAIKNWEDAVGAKIFEYDPQKGMPINLVITKETIAIKKERGLKVESDKLDKQWEKLDEKREGLNAQLDELHEKRDGLNTQLDLLEIERLGLKTKYDVALKSWDAPRGKHDAKSSDWLDDAYRNLKELRMSQNELITYMNVYVDPINKINDEINLAVEQQNRIRDSQVLYSEAIEKFNNAGVWSGLFSGDSILGPDYADNIYVCWANTNYDLILTITHELAHAIGFHGHVSDPSAIMYPSSSLSSSNQTVKQQDLNAIYPYLRYRNLMQ